MALQVGSWLSGRDSHATTGGLLGPGGWLKHLQWKPMETQATNPYQLDFSGAVN